MINMLRAFVGKVDNMQEQTGNVNRDRNPKKEYKGKTRKRNHCNRNQVYII